jgi:hypothetical protein
MDSWLETLQVKNGELLAEVRLSFLQRDDLVELCFDVDNTTIEAVTESETLVSEILNRLPSLETAVSAAAFKYYQFLVEAFRNDVEVQLPVAADANALQALYQLTTIYLPSELTPGHFGLGFDCEFEIEHGMGIRFRSWEIEEVGDVTEALSLD